MKRESEQTAACLPPMVLDCRAAGRVLVNHGVSQLQNLPGSPQGLAQAIDDLYEHIAQHPGEILKDDRRTTVRKIDWQGRAWIFKQYHQSGWKRLIYSMVRQSPAWREWRGAQWLAEAGAGVRCNPPWAMGQGMGQQPGQWLILPYVAGQTLAAYLQGEHHLRKPSSSKLARAIGTQLGTIIRAGLVNRDYKPTNLILDDACVLQGKPPMIIDPAGVRRRRNEDQMFRMFAVLLRSSLRIADVSRTEQMRCAKAMMQAAGEKTGERQIEYVVRHTLRCHHARPLSYDPTPAQRQRMGK